MIYVPGFIIASTGSERQPQKFSLETAVTYALAHNPLIERTHIERRQARLLLEEVRAQSILPQFSFSGETGLVPEARGDIFESPDKQTDLDGWGPFYKLNVKLVQPVFTFGRKSSALSAARIGIDLQHIKSDSEMEKLTLTVINAYFALSAANKAESTANEVQENYDKLEKEVKKRLESEDSEVDDTDLLEVKSNRYLIEEIVIKSKSGRKLAERAFNVAIGRDIVGAVEVLEEKIPVIQLDEHQMVHVVQQALLRHRDIRGLQAALQALRAKTKLAYSKRRPIIFLVGGFGYGYASHRQDQTNPFAVDNFNYMDLGAFFGFQWDLNFLRKNIEARRYQLEQASMAQNLKLLRSRIEMEILKAFTEIKKNVQLLDQARSSLKAAKSWLRLSMDNWDMGIGEVERLLKAYNAYYQLKGVEIKRSFDLNSSLANFAYILGNTRLYLEWIKNGKVKIF
ncbi:MAG: TolC family protein [Candidatus Aminicenantes bacterium]|nr:MAG: TolC family protein [Candidatus Aminicenantes bacterium]